MYQESDIDVKWNKLIEQLYPDFGKVADVQSILFLIGINELGQGKRNYTKEEKRDLIHIGNCKILSFSGFFTLEGMDSDGWPIWKPNQKIPNLSVSEQEKFIKWHILEYFDNL